VAKLQEEVVVIKVSKLLKDNETENVVLTVDTITSLEAVIQELAGANTLVEIQVA
jgi:hypothetical protein